MATDIGGMDPLNVSLRDYVDGLKLNADAGHDQHEERHTREHSEHKATHDVEKEALAKLAALVAAQRTEDARTVEVALTAVQAAAQIHAAAHEQQHAAHQQIHDIEKDAIGKATEQMDRRLAGMNGFRDALRDQASQSMPRELAISQIDAVRRESAAQVEDLRSTLLTLHSRLDVIQGQGKGASSTIGYVIAASTLALGGMGLLITLILRNYGS